MFPPNLVEACFKQVSVFSITCLLFLSSFKTFYSILSICLVACLFIWIFFGHFCSEKASTVYHVTIQPTSWSVVITHISQISDFRSKCLLLFPRCPWQYKTVYKRTVSTRNVTVALNLSDPLNASDSALGGVNLSQVLHTFQVGRWLYYSHTHSQYYRRGKLGRKCDQKTLHNLIIHFLYCLITLLLMCLLVYMCLAVFFAYLLIFLICCKDLNCDSCDICVDLLHIPLGIATFSFHCTSCMCMWRLNFLNLESGILYIHKDL